MKFKKNILTWNHGLRLVSQEFTQVFPVILASVGDDSGCGIKETLHLLDGLFRRTIKRLSRVVDPAIATNAE